MKDGPWWERFAVKREYVPVVVVIALLVWLFQPAGIPPATQLREAASVAGFLLLIAAGAGVAAMATVQFWKLLFLPRAAFHAAELKSLFGTNVGQVLGLAAPTPEDAAPSPHEPKEFAHLLDTPTEVLMGQLRSTADYILLRPEGFENALYRLGGDAGTKSIKTYLEQRKGLEDQTDDSGSANRPSSSHDALVEARFFVEQHLNLVHVDLKERWRRRVRVVAVTVAGSTGLLTMSLSTLGPTAKISTIVAAMIWGGFFAWFARDVVALVERRRA